jgi:cell division protein FtsL
VTPGIEIQDEGKEIRVKETFEQNQTLVSNEEDVPREAEENLEDHRLGVSMLLRIALGVVVIVSLVISVSSVMRFNELEEQKAALEEQIKEKDKEIGELRYLVDAPMDDEYIARIAQERLGLEFPDEKQYYNDLND